MLILEEVIVVGEGLRRQFLRIFSLEWDRNVCLGLKLLVSSLHCDEIEMR
jgi:hypothetical protein